MIFYELDGEDRIAAVGGDWDAFARGNNGGAIAGTAVLGRSLWDFIAGDTVREIYSRMLGNARAGRDSQGIIFRCDGPGTRRIQEMDIHLTPESNVRFSFRTLSEKRRPPVRLLGEEVPRDSAILQCCSWCNRIQVGESRWEEVEQAVRELGLFQRELLPQLSHGICAHCCEKAFPVTCAIPEEDCDGAMGVVGA